MRPTIYLFGDSITEQSFLQAAWGASLANLYCRRADVVLRGYGGYNTRWALRVLNQGKVFPPPQSSGGAPLAVTVFFGANDAALPDSFNAGVHVPLEEYKQNLHSIVAIFKERWPTTSVIFITPPPIDEAARLLDPDNKLGVVERTNKVAGKYAKACVAVAADCGIPSIDLWSKMQQSPGWQKAFLSDGLHLTPAGNTIVFEEVVRKFEEIGLKPEMLPLDLPLCNDLVPPNDALEVLDKFS
ncbi:hypothetical protein Leryth_026678 [Lithospermum erythrorhizon]|nr:hypothetical protein Leryth_026678 [Lithospermum erythrorhizon]